MIPDLTNLPIKYINESEDFKYELTQPVMFLIKGMNVNNFILYDENDNKLAEYKDRFLTVHTGFKWDGCTLVGKFYEDRATLMSSISHDIFYIVRKSIGSPIKVNLFRADKVFRRFLVMYGFNRTLSWLYYLGLITIGLPWKFNKTYGYRVSAL